MLRRLTLGCILWLSTALVHAQIDPELLAGMKARSIGPATMSGRVAAIDAVESDPDIVYAGAATGGVWKSVNGGLTWQPIFDDQPVHAIGAIAIFQPNPDIVWVGTGEGNVRNSASVGNGIYRSLDGGRTWKHLGLEKTERIYRIVLHPSSSEIAWVSALGEEWGENSERGIFKTTDGGKTWKKVLYVNERTGGSDLVIDPSNPNKLFASMWEYRRWPWFFNSGGPGSGLYVTYDGGDEWKRLTEEDGLPKGDLGRIGLAIARSNPSIVYALVEAEKSALIRSDDGGKSWKTVNGEPDVAPRPFYFCDLRVDPKDPNRVYNLWTLISVSNDGGKSFEVLVPFAKIHPDHHAMWINPNDPTHMYGGNDGGVGVSRDRGRMWDFIGNLPLGQYYHINVDDEVPYNVYGGMQDNGSWRGPSLVWENGGIRNHHWREVAFGDGFATIAIREDTKTGYAMSQEGYIVRWDFRTGERKDIRPPAPEGVELRFNWNAGIAVDPFDPNTVYYGSQFVHKSTNRGESWTIVSPDLTTNNKQWQHQKKSGGITPDVTGAENFETIMTIAPSAVEKGVIWVGTDDGRIQITRDGGANWTSVEANVKGVPRNTWVPHIEPSKFDGGTAFAVFDNHRRSDGTTYVYKTTDYGKTWTSLATKDIRGYALAIEQDPVEDDLLFLGTEFGLFVSIDGGKSWLRWNHGIPTASVMALMVHPREHDLVVGTHGRSAYILDDIRPLRAMSKEAMSKMVHLFEIANAQQYRVKQTGGERFPGDGEFRGENRPYGAILTYVLNAPGLPHPKDEKERERKEKEREAKRKPRIESTGVPQETEDVPKEPGAEAAAEKEKSKEAAEETKDDEKPPQVEIKVADASGKVIRTFKGPAKLGVNRATWNLRRDAFKEPPRPDDDRPADERSGPEVLPGTYKVTVKYNDQEMQQTVRVLADPRIEVSETDRQAKWTAIVRSGELSEKIAEAIERIQKTRADIDAASGKVPKEKKDSAVAKEAKALKAKLDAMEKRLWTPPKTKGIVAETDVQSKIGYVHYSLQSSWDAPTASQMAYFKQAEDLLRAVIADFNKLYAEDVAKFRETVRKEQLELLPELKPIEMD